MSGYRRVVRRFVIPPCDALVGGIGIWWLINTDFSNTVAVTCGVIWGVLDLSDALFFYPASRGRSLEEASSTKGKGS